jgi:large subunit ribosomal protein L25
MDKVKLESKTREEKGKKTNKGRKAGLVPAVVYGRGIKSENLWVKSSDFTKLLKKAGESTLIDLKIDEKNGRNVIIHEIQRDPVSYKIIHADFYQVRMDEKIETKVELVFVGEALAVKDLGGILVKNVTEVEVKCLPVDLPSHIDVDISPLKTFEDRILAKDLKIDKEVEIAMDPETVVALVTPPRSEEELKELETKVEEDLTKVEGMVKEEAPAEGETEKKEEKKEEKK